MTAGRAFVTNEDNNVCDRMSTFKGYEISFIGGMLLPVRMGTGTKRAGTIIDFNCYHSPKKSFIC
jgi:hypothetical protein